MSRSFELSEVEWATVGAVGPPGQRTFYLQARQGDQQITLKLEKQQVAAVAQFLGEILSDLPVAEPLPDDDLLALAEPVLAEWAVGGLQLAYDSGADRIVILAEEISGEVADPQAGEIEAEEIEEIGGPDIGGPGIGGPGIGGPDFSGPDISGPDLSGPDLGGPDIGGPDFSGESGPEHDRPEHDRPENDQAVGRLSLTRTQAAAIVRRGWELVQAGRPTCALCGHPIDPEGHSCPRTNGHRAPAP